MATITVRPAAAADKQATKPTRSMTHPLHDSSKQPSKPKFKPSTGQPSRKPKQGEPFDPDELTRRLESHLVEQRLASQRRRDARAAKAATAAKAAAEAEAQVVYHHVPKVAASAFERTTTPDVMRQIHKLAQPAVKQSREVLKVDKRSLATRLKRNQALDQATIERNLTRNRNNFQWDQCMEDATEVDIARDLYSPPQRTFIAEFAHLRPKQPPTTTGIDHRRPLSTGDMMLGHDDDTHQAARITRAVLPVYDPRIDRTNWAQRDDEEEARTKNSVGSPTTLEMEKEKEKAPRKKESGWILRGIKSPRHEKEKEDVVSSTADFGSSPPEGGGRSAKASFLARFKRHPS